MQYQRKRQLSLRRLLVVATIVTPLLAFAALYPVATAELVTVNLLLVAPAAIVFGVACWLSNNKRRTIVVLCTGIFFGWLLTPKLFVNWSRAPTFWDEFKIDFNTTGIFMLGGAVTAFAVDLIATAIAAVRERSPNAG